MALIIFLRCEEHPYNTYQYYHKYVITVMQILMQYAASSMNVSSVPCSVFASYFSFKHKYLLIVKVYIAVII